MRAPSMWSGWISSERTRTPDPLAPLRLHSDASRGKVVVRIGE